MSDRQMPSLLWICRMILCLEVHSRCRKETRWFRLSTGLRDAFQISSLRRTGIPRGTVRLLLHSLISSRLRRSCFRMVSKCFGQITACRGRRALSFTPHFLCLTHNSSSARVIDGTWIAIRHLRRLTARRPDLRDIYASEASSNCSLSDSRRIFVLHGRHSTREKPDSAPSLSKMPAVLSILTARLLVHGSL